MSTFDRRIAAWIETDGPSTVPAATVDGALARARAIGQRRRPSLPGVDAWTVRRPLAIGVVLVALALALAAAVVGAGLLLRSPAVPLIHIAPDPRHEGVTRAIPLPEGRILLLGMSPAGGGLAGVLESTTGETAWLDDPGGQTPLGPAAALMADGRVMLAGGWRGDDSQSRAAILLDPVTMAAEPLEAMTMPRGIAFVLKVFSPVTVTLPDGRLLIVGGSTEQLEGWTEPHGADLFDPRTGHFMPTRSIPCPDDHDTPAAQDRRSNLSGHEIRWATLLADGRVLLACDEWPAWPGRQTLLAWDVDAGTFEDLGIVLDGAHRMLPLGDGSLLLWTWRSREQVPASGELARHEQYGLARLDPATGALAPLPAVPLSMSGATLLADGRVVFVGGFEPGQALPSGAIQVLDPCSGTLTTVATLGAPRADPAVVEVRPGQLLVIGGDGGDQVMAKPVGAEVVPLPAGRACEPA